MAIPKVEIGHGGNVASAWVVRFAPLIPPRGPVLDLAARKGRHARHRNSPAPPLPRVDSDLAGLAALAGAPLVERLQADLENAPWPLEGRRFAGVVVTNYLWRALLPHLVVAVAPDGLLIYETF